jgi:hypothetical protein
MRQFLWNRPAGDNMRGLKILMAAGFVGAFAPISVASAESVLNLTTVGSSATDQGVIYQQMNQQPTGTGVIKSFVRIEQNSHEQGYNTDHRPVQFDEKQDATYTHSLQLASLTAVAMGGQSYYQFLLDINETDTTAGRMLSLNKIELFQTNDDSINGYAEAASSTTTAGSLGDTFTSSASTMIYNLDTGSNGDQQITLNYDLNSGSGSGDMYMYVPTSKFVAGYSDVVLYSYFGVPYTSSAGFEEWATLSSSNTPSISTPLPASVWSGLVILAGLAGARAVTMRRRRDVAL